MVMWWRQSTPMVRFCGGGGGGGARLVYWFTRRSSISSKLLGDAHLDSACWGSCRQDFVSGICNSSSRIIDGYGNSSEKVNSHGNIGGWMSSGVHVYGDWQLGGAKKIHATGSKSMSEKDYYRILGVNWKASSSQIQNAYYALAKKLLHPDYKNNKEDTEKEFKEVQKAYEVLKDEGMRSHYDRKYYYPRESDFSGPASHGEYVEVFLELSLREAVNGCFKRCHFKLIYIATEKALFQQEQANL
ncbi:DnaJ domain [Macleaya cordata]|uniref:DnaJ domain n=1 Tax=Macleaya cordata TaxID=56857 RepID=A0A200PWQ8_MACCD|nr:DnaJ domain [Macleaya cordata]